MRLLVQILIGAAILIGALWVLNIIGALVGLLFWLLIAAVIGGAVVGVIKANNQEKRALKGPGPRAERKLDQQADKDLKDMEKRLKQ